MYFSTIRDWRIIYPLLNLFRDPDSTEYYWRAVEMRFSVYYYHVLVTPDMSDENSSRTTILCGSIESALGLLNNFPRSSLALQVPDWLNNGEPGLYRVAAVYKTAVSVAQTYIAECADGKMFALDLDQESMDLTLNEVEKVTLWTQLQAN